MDLSGGGLVVASDTLMGGVEMWNVASLDPEGRAPTVGSLWSEVAGLQLGDVEVVVLPESVLRPGDIDELEALLARHGVFLLVAGVREPPDQAGRFGANWLHLGVSFGGRWWHYRQNKHNRWFLDSKQIEQYHLSAALPRRRGCGGGRP